MALVVSARSRSVELTRASGARLRWLSFLAAICAALVLLVEGSARIVLPSGSADDVAVVLWVGLAAVALGVATLAWLDRRDAPWLLLASTLAPLAIALRVVLGGLLIALDVPTLAYLAQAGLGWVSVGLLVWTACAAQWSGADAQGAPLVPRSERLADVLFTRVADVTLLMLFATGLAGSAVEAVGAGWACRGFPDCNGLGVLPFGREPLADVHLYHRLLAFIAAALAIWLAVEARRTQRGRAGIGSATLVLAAVTLFGGAAGAVGTSSGLPVLAQLLHAAGAIGTWSAAVVVGVLAHRCVAASNSAPAGMRAATLLRAYVQLTKPRVMSLLLATTAAAMVIAARGMPSLGVFVATLVGGALMSGGAGAINHYVDRDIDPLMGRTAWRPIPSGVIAPKRALWFGVALGAIATLVFVLLVNVLAAVLAVLGLLGYVFIYTLWLKRSTPSNIVIGGAAGALPPMVGWAAVTNEIGSLTVWYLFAIIFFWTPPHFWALSLLIRKHYERAGVPMLPVVRGEEETRRQIVLYSLLLVALSVVMAPAGLMGLPYFFSALVLGGLFVAYALRLWRAASPKAARRLYLYSLLYLFALFTAMAVDRVL